MQSWEYKNETKGSDTSVTWPGHVVRMKLKRFPNNDSFLYIEDEDAQERGGERGGERKGMGREEREGERRQPGRRYPADIGE